MTEDQGLTDENSPTEPTSNQAHHGQILLVEDEPILLRAIEVMLTTMGYEVISALNGSDALSLYRDHISAIDLVVADFALPHKSGKRFLLALQDIDPNIKIVVMTGYNLQDHERNFLKTHQIGFLRKPFNYRQLRDAVQSKLKH